MLKYFRQVFCKHDLEITKKQARYIQSKTFRNMKLQGSEKEVVLRTITTVCKKCGEINIRKHLEHEGVSDL